MQFVNLTYKLKGNPLGTDGDWWDIWVQSGSLRHRILHTM